MSIPLAAVGAVVAALLETSVVPGITSVGKPDILLVCTIVATMMLSIEDGLTWAFLGGLMTDFLLPGRQLGATSLTLLLMAGAAAVVARIFPQRRVLTTVAAVFLLSWVYEALIIVVLAATSGTPAPIEPLALAPSVIVNTVLAIPLAAIAQLLWLRFGAHDRAEW
ncbi:MAG: rod shape-determining protein MreD [Candidatus Limnocylindrales bacterium]